MNDSAYSRIQMRIQKEIRRSEDCLVQWIEKALKETSYGKSGRDKLEESQFRNLIRVAETTESTEVIINFVRYQMGREKKWGRGEKSLGKRIIKNIKDELKRKTEDIVETVKEQEVEAERRRLKKEKENEDRNTSTSADDPQIAEKIEKYAEQTSKYIDHKEIWITLIRLYLGYGARSLKYLIMTREEQVDSQNGVPEDKLDKSDKTRKPTKNKIR